MRIILITTTAAAPAAVVTVYNRAHSITASIAIAAITGKSRVQKTEIRRNVKKKEKNI